MDSSNFETYFVPHLVSTANFVEVPAEVQTFVEVPAEAPPTLVVVTLLLPSDLLVGDN